MFVIVLLFSSCKVSSYKDENYYENEYSGEDVVDGEAVSKLDIKRVSHQFDRKYFTFSAETSFGLYEYIARYNIPERFYSFTKITKRITVS